MALADLLSQLDARPGVRGRQFERICAWYLRNAPEYRERIRKVWLWSDWPGAWAADAGIDLVAEERDGRLWAIQAKAYDPSYAIKKADVDSFLSESSRRAVLVSAADRDDRPPRSDRAPDARLSTRACRLSAALPTGACAGARGLPRRMTCGPGDRRARSRFHTFVKRSERPSGALRTRSVGS